jgi:hypothetical protein
MREEWTMLEPNNHVSPVHPAPSSPSESKRSTRGPGRRGIFKFLLALAFIGATLVGISSLASARTSSACSGSVAEKAVCQARAQQDDPYVWAGKGPSVFDCSGLTYYAYRKAGLDWSYRTAAGQYSYGVSKGLTVSTRNLRPGDLVFFNWDGGEIDHVGIYVGNGKMVHASSGRGKVVESTLNSYYRSHMLRSAVRPTSGSAKSNDGAEKETNTKPKHRTRPHTEPGQAPVVVVPFN